MATYWIGTSGYSYKAVEGPLLPGVAARRRDAALLRRALHRRRDQLHVLPLRQRAQLQSWAKEVPEHFTFTLKAPRRITHELRLRDAADVAADFCDTARALKHKLGALLFQLPPFLKRDTPRLEDFLHQLPEGFRVAFEFRNPTWFADEVYETLRRFGVAMCIVEAPERAVPFEATADFGYFRLRQPDVRAMPSWRRCAERIQSAPADWRDVFIYFKHEDDGAGPGVGDPPARPARRRRRRRSPPVADARRPSCGTPRAASFRCRRRQRLRRRHAAGAGPRRTRPSCLAHGAGTTWITRSSSRSPTGSPARGVADRALQLSVHRARRPRSRSGAGAGGLLPRGARGPSATIRR